MQSRLLPSIKSWCVTLIDAYPNALFKSGGKKLKKITSQYDTWMEFGRDRKWII
jgi:hypothetical protein